MGKDLKKIASSFVEEMIKQNLTYSECNLITVYINECLANTKPTI